MLLSMSFNYTLLHLTLYFVAFCLAFCCIHLAFWCKMHCVLVHIAMRFAAKRSATTSD